MTQPTVAPLPDIDDNSYGRLDFALGRWLVLVRSHTVTVHVVVALAIASIVNLVFFTTHSSLPSGVHAVGAEIVVLSISIGVPILLTGAALRGSFRVIFALIGAGPGRAAPVMLRLVSEEMSSLQELVGELRDEGLVVAQASTSEWVRRRCLLVVQGRYLSADSCVPTVFLDRYRDLMVAHADFLERVGTKDSVRVNVAPRAALAADRRANPNAYREYLEWHRKHDVALLRVDYDIAVGLAEQANLGEIVDWSLWVDELALSWAYEDAGVRLRMSFVGDLQYKRCYRLIQRLIDHPTRMVL